MGSLLGIDLGEKRIGFALCTEGTTLAVPLETVECRGRKQMLDAISRLSEEYQASTLVVGLPKTLKNEIGPAAQKVMELVEWFKSQLAKEWIYWDERLSTAEIERVLLDADLSRARRKEVRDQLAAQRILQNYIDFERSRGQL